ncbi:MAG: hypothetical protein R3E87_01970, partial [Burkholderiaceae bacterium]
MKIAQKLVLQSCIATAALLVVAGTGAYSVKIIDSDLRVMIDEVMPLNEVVMRMDGATERFVSGILEMERARTAEELAAAKTRVGKER